MLHTIYPNDNFRGFRVDSTMHSLSNRSWSLIILPIEQCNFDCFYCYEKKLLGKMSASTVASIKKMIAKRIDDSALKYLHIGWFGGEPLLAKEIIFDIHDFIKGKAKSDFNFSSDITTNGYLLDQKTFAKLLALNIADYQITLDGDKDFHDKTRCRKDGVGTFDKIWHNLIEIKKIPGDFTILIRLHVHADNVDSMRRLISKIKKTFTYDKRFQVFIRGISKLGGDNEAAIKEHANVDVVVNEFCTALGGEVEVYRWNLEKDGNYICYASRPNSIMIRPDGSLGKCTVALEEEVNKIGSINADGTLNIDSENLKFWLAGFRAMDKKLTCPYYNSKIPSRCLCDETCAGKK